MKSPQKIKADLAKQKALKQQQRHEEQLQAVESVKAELRSLYELLNGKQEFEPELLTKQFEQLQQSLDLKAELKAIQEAVNIQNTVQIDIDAIIKAIEANKPDIKVDFSRLEKAIVEVQQRVQEGSALEQAPEDFQPYRRVVKIGNRLVFDDNPTGSGGRGGNSIPLINGSVPVVNPDGSSIATGGAGGGLTDAELRASPVAVTTDSQKDIFGYQVVIQPYNQIELRGDDADWADFVTETNANGGDTAQSGGLLNISTSTGATGSAILNSVDQVRYRPGVGVYGAGTMIFTTGVAGSVQYFGLATSTAMANGVMFGYKGTSFGIRYTRNGSEVSFTAQASWDDPCQGGATSNFTRNGTAETLDPTRPNLYRIEAGLFGFAGWRAQVWSPDNGWITVLTYEHINTATTEPVFTSNTFYMLAVNTKTSGATDIVMKTQCWGAGTGSNAMRVGSTSLSDRTLAQISRSVIAGRSTAGGSSYVNVKVSPSGAVQIGGTLDSVTSLPLPSGAATSAKQDTGNTSVASIDTNTAYKFAPGKLRYTNIISASTSITPTAGKAIQVINTQVIPASANASDVQIYINFATSSIDIFKGYAGGGYYVRSGAVNEVLTITQTGTGSVQVLVDYLEI